MSLQVAIAVALLLVLVVAVVSAPLRGEQRRTDESASEPAHLDPQILALHEDLEAEREAKYREIRDAELDYRTGKLSLEDYTAVDAGLRAQALQILNRLEDLGVDPPRGEGAEQGPAREPVDD